MFYEIFVIGAGGTGTFFLKEVSRFLAGNKNIFAYHIFDGDVVERKNLARQSFIEDDIGRNKASVMAEILQDAFQIPWRAHDSYVTAPEQLTKLFTGKGRRGNHCDDVIPVIVSCVDNHACRLLLESIFEKEPNCILFDSGNEFTTGEVVLAYKRAGKIFGPVRSVYFPDVKNGDIRSRTEMSCEELNNVAPQHIFTNMMAANILASAISNLFEEKLTPGFVYFNTLKYQVEFVPYRGAIVDTTKQEEKENVKNSGRRSAKRKAG